MRLIHTKTLQLEEFFDSDIPKYAILSHRWDAKELSFQEFQNSKRKSGTGFSKINKFCSLAKREGFEWAWVDTCCIDKKSSAELSEAINSMYRWYQDAEACYAYLPDVLWEDGNILRSHASFRQSVWFTRGWTLQELLAPSTVYFLDRNWARIGAKECLWDDISAVTGISIHHLQFPIEASVATKMSWASKRKTSRTEDIAYCLMGLFDINMPLLYGEGKKAFLRLQLEILKQSDDESIFAWISPASERIYSGLLATSPSWFAESKGISSCRYWDRPPYSMTNHGLEFRIPLSTDGPIEVHDWYQVEIIKVVLNCSMVDSEGCHAIAIWLLRAQFGWQRCHCRCLGRSPWDKSKGSAPLDEKRTRTLYVYQPGVNHTDPSSYPAAM